MDDLQRSPSPVETKLEVVIEETHQTSVPHTPIVTSSILHSARHKADEQAASMIAIDPHNPNAQVIAMENEAGNVIHVVNAAGTSNLVSLASVAGTAGLQTITLGGSIHALPMAISAPQVQVCSKPVSSTPA
jgi:hypothetical protein